MGLIIDSTINSLLDLRCEMDRNIIVPSLVAFRRFFNTFTKTKSKYRKTKLTFQEKVNLPHSGREKLITKNPMLTLK